MRKTYRKFKNGDVIYLLDYNNISDDYYCEATYYEDDGVYQKEFLLNNSKKANILDIIKYKINRLLHKL